MGSMPSASDAAGAVISPVVAAHKWAWGKVRGVFDPKVPGVTPPPPPPDENAPLVRAMARLATERQLRSSRGLAESRRQPGQTQAPGAPPAPQGSLSKTINTLPTYTRAVASRWRR